MNIRTMKKDGVPGGSFYWVVREASRSFLGKESVSMETVFPGNTQLPGVRRGALFGLSGMVMVSLDRPQRSVCQRK